MMRDLIETLNWEKGNGLIPAMIQDHNTNQILMLGYMNKEALRLTYETGQVTFYSRTKKRLWTKGETSGHVLNHVNISSDCDQDTLLIRVIAKGPCCHLNTISCFENDEFQASNTLTKIIHRIEKRYHEKSEQSYTAKLFAEGTYRIAQKVGEEGVEVALACVSGSKKDTINEVSDLIFHLFILLKQCDIDFSEILSELDRRYTQLKGNI